MKTILASMIGMLAAGGVTSAHAQGVIVPAPGYAITWDGNDGAYFSSASPALVPDNLALAAHGATAFATSQLGPQLGLGFHRSGNLNDGLYGNFNSWIGGDGDSAPLAGISLGAAYLINRFAFGRDNGNDTTEGQLADRSLGLYTLQFTRLSNPGLGTAFTADPATGWATIGTLNFAASQDTILGGGFTSYLRHEYALGTAAGDPLQATGIRLLVPAAGLSAGTALDELEVSFVPEPGIVMLLLAGFGGMVCRRWCRNGARCRF